LVLLGLTLGALGHVAVHLKHLEVALQLGDARKERARLEEQRRQLVLEVGVLKDPTRIMEVARERLGLGPPSAADIVPVSDLRARMVARTAGPVEKAAKPEAGSEKRQDEGAREANP
jgi:cell division protein FtsL